MGETKEINGVRNPNDYDMWFVGGVPHRKTDLSEKMTSLVHKVFPVPWQHSFRDYGGSGHLFHGLAIVKGLSLSIADPKLGGGSSGAFVGIFHHSNTPIEVYNFALNHRITTYKYGSHPSQIIEVIPRKSPQGGMPLKPDYVTVFFHGGAWGSGTPKFYRLYGDILTETEGHTVVLIGYRIYPAGSVENQIEDLGLALKWMEENRDRIGLFRTAPFILSGHSSGSHIGSMYLIRRSLNPELYVGHAAISGFISISGVFDIWAQYRIEEFRGYHELSPLKGCTGPELHHMRQYSPVPVVYSQLTREAAERFPPTFLMHGMKDEVVPFTHSSEFQAALLSKGVKSVTLEFTDAGHFDIIKAIMMPSPGDTAVASIQNFCSRTFCVPRSKL